MKIVKASDHDLQEIFQLLQECTSTMLSKGVDQWHKEYPSLLEVQNDFDSDGLYVGKTDSSIIATITLNQIQPKSYENLHWTYPLSESIVIHRLAVRPSHWGLGLGNELMLFAETYCIENNLKAIRLDAFSQNKFNLSFYEKLDYIIKGSVAIANASAPCIAFEKLISS